MYTYDKRNQLLQVADMQGNVAEKYAYDPAGNILSKTVDGKTTTFTYDKANQLATSSMDGKVTHYRYDAAGRLVEEGEKSYRYGYLDKILSVDENGQNTAAFDYHLSGQLASATHDGKTENFLWDGLALIHRGTTSYINEPYVTGGNPLLSSKGGVMFNDMLGSTLGVKGETYDPVKMTAFGETDNHDAFFTGKPAVGELGFAFLFRNYRAGQGKWQTADPLGYPDGWNNLAYVRNSVILYVDFMGGFSVNGDDNFTNWVYDVFNTINNSVNAGDLTGLPKNIGDLINSNWLDINQSENWPNYSKYSGNLQVDNYQYTTQDGKTFTGTEALLHELLHKVGYSHINSDMDALLKELYDSIPKLKDVEKRHPVKGTRQQE